MRTCDRCHAVKPEIEFYNKRKRKDGKDTVCAECRRAEMALRRKMFPEKFREYSQRSYWKHREAYLAQKRVYYRNNRERCLELSRLWRERNDTPEYRAYKKAYDKERNVQKALDKLRGGAA